MTQSLPRFKQPPPLPENKSLLLNLLKEIQAFSAKDTQDEIVSKLKVTMRVFIGN